VFLWHLKEIFVMSRLFELRTYEAMPGKLAALEARFRDITLGYFEKHGMEAIGFWRNTDSPDGIDRLVYLLAFPDRVSAEASWESFKADAEWQRAKTATEINGRLNTNTISVFMSPTDFSAIS
jgi:NIPSNAP